LVSNDRLTLLVSTSEHAAWMAAAAGLPMVVRAVDGHSAWTAALGRTDSDAVLVRPDGHIAALLQYEPDAVNLRKVVASFGISSMAYEERTA
jgi:sulfur relay (sulfurtransferase) DsrF/TusC family protein